MLHSKADGGGGGTGEGRRGGDLQRKSSTAIETHVQNWSVLCKNEK